MTKMPILPETFTVPCDTDSVTCNGGDVVLGHPVVWYAFNGGKRVTCGYCDNLFVKQ